MLEKENLRKEMLKKRDSLAQNSRTALSKTASRRLFALEEFKKAKCIAFYLSKGSEIDTSKMIKEAMKTKEILVPVTNNEIELVKFVSFDELAPAKFGVLEPKIKAAAEKEPDVIIVPAIAFDSDLHRLGYGRGYYDKLLKKIKSIRVGICFDFQIVEKLPRHGHDVKMDVVLSDKRIMRD